MYRGQDYRLSEVRFRQSVHESLKLFLLGTLTNITITFLVNLGGQIYNYRNNPGSTKNNRVQNTWTVVDRKMIM